MAKLPPATCRIPTKLEWKHNASTGAYIANLGPATRLVRSGRAGRYLYRAEYWGDYSLDFPIGYNALTPTTALKGLCADVAKLRRKKR